MNFCEKTVTPLAFRQISVLQSVVHLLRFPYLHKYLEINSTSSLILFRFLLQLMITLYNLKSYL